MSTKPKAGTMSGWVMLYDRGARTEEKQNPKA